MKKEETNIQNKKGFFEGRAVIAGTIAVTAFLCLFTVFEIAAIKMEWNIPILNVFVSGADSTFFDYYREKEEELEASTKNEAEKSDIAEESENEATEEIVDGTEEKEGSSEWTGNVSLGENTDILRGDRIEQELESEVIQVEEKEESVESVLEKKERLPFYIKINRQQNVVTIYGADEKGEYTIPVKAILCSTGLYNATPKGTFHLSSKYVWRELHGGVYGQYASRITGGILFHSVPYSRKSKSALYWDKYNKLGQQASMGCVRLTVADAKWIYDNCPSGTAVEIYDSEDPGPLGKPQTLKLDKDSVNKGWDPTDPDERNPWHEWSADE